jgi:drug/metabolite transporter (DMT)-like permease
MPTSVIKKIPSWVLFISVASFWGLNMVAMRVAGRQVPPLTVAASRSLVGGLVLLALARRKGARLPNTRDEWKGIAAIALMMTGMSTAFIFLAAKNAPAGLASILTNTMPLFVAILAPILLKEQVSLKSGIGLLLGLAGAVIVAWRAIEGDVKPAGVVFGILGAVTAALGGIMYKKFPLPGVDRLMVVAIQLLMSCVVLTLAALPENRSHMTFRWTFWLSFVYLSLLGLATSFVFFSELISRGSSLQASAVAYLSTFLGVLFGALFLRERLSASVLIGGAIAIVGVAIVQAPSRKPHSPA